jgi:hypothetical protein
MGSQIRILPTWEIVTHLEMETFERFSGVLEKV